MVSRESMSFRSLFSRKKQLYGFINIYIFAELYIFFGKDSEFLIHIHFDVEIQKRIIKDEALRQCPAQYCREGNKNLKKN